jgi:hypothetical protein
MCYKKKGSFILKVIPFLVFLFFFAAAQAQTFKVDPIQKTQNMYWETEFHSIFFAHFKPNQFFRWF